MNQERIRHTDPKDEPRFKCQFPDCGKLFWKEPGEPDACPEHRKLIRDVVFILNRLESVPSETAEEGPKILVPKPGMADQAIQHELKRRGKTQ